MITTYSKAFSRICKPGADIFSKVNEPATIYGLPHPLKGYCNAST
jgi:hypothetical protein